MEHPPPTAATAKLLYARAFACAHPNCPEPLYREDKASGAWTLNSRICHINARREGGPRWDSQQSSEDNRSEDNLVIMCLKHASAIDDPKALSAYPAALLCDWKRSQIEDHQRRMSGWPLTEAMADDVVRISISNGDIDINGSTINLAGQGGQATGAGGGGGGAIGHGSRAGRGGDGGKMYTLDLSPADSFDGGMDFSDLDMPMQPGAGGGGAGAIGEGSIAGDGGSGGDMVSGRLEVEPGDNLEIEIGEPGKGATLPGQHGIDGGDVVIKLKSPDGTLKRTIRAKAGAAAKAGRLPDDVAAISSADIADGFQVSTLLLVNAAEIRDGLAYILGGGWSRYNVPALLNAHGSRALELRWTAKVNGGFTFSPGNIYFPRLM